MGGGHCAHLPRLAKGGDNEKTKTFGNRVSRVRCSRKSIRVCKNGDEVEVSDDKAAQLFADFGKEWVEVETPRVVEVEPVKVKGKK